MRPLLIITFCILALYVLKVYYLDVDSKQAVAVATSSVKKPSSKLTVDVYIAKEVTKNNVVYASGTIVPNEEVELRTELSGRLTQLNIKEGASIQKGQLIAKLNDNDFLAQLKKIKYEEELATQTEARYKKLLDINAIGKEEYDLAVNKINTLSADKEYLQVQIEKTQLKAPFSGKIGFKNVSEGAYVSPNTVIANLVQTNPIKLDFSLPEKYASSIRLGQTVDFTIDGSDEKRSAKIVAIDPKIDENLRTLRVRAKTQNSKGNLLPGMFVRVEAPLGDDKFIMIPTQAIIPILKGKKVYVVKSGIATEALITTGLRTDKEIAVEEGLSVGDTVIVSALMSLKEGMPVHPR